MRNSRKDIIEEEKRVAGEKAAEIVKKMGARAKRPLKIGLGTGSTTKYFVEALGRLVKNGFRAKTISTSNATAKLARKLKIPSLGQDYNSIPAHELDVYVDGTDEVSAKNFCLIKGGGGALMREEMVAGMAKKIIIIADSRKLVPELGKFPLPIEVMDLNCRYLADTLKKKYRCKVELRKDSCGRTFVTDNGNHILDAGFSRIKNPETLKKELKLLPGALCVGLFTGKIRPDVLIIANKIIPSRKR